MRFLRLISVMRAGSAQKVGDEEDVKSRRCGDCCPGLLVIEDTGTVIDEEVRSAMVKRLPM